MALTLKSTSRTAKGKLTIYFKGGHQTTFTVWCSRSEMNRKRSELCWINGSDSKETKVYWNGQVILN